MTVSTFADPSGVHNPAPATAAPATWFSQLHTNFLAVRNRPCGQIRASGSQSLSANSVTQINLGTVVFDNSSLMTGTAHALTIPTNYGGIWAVTAQVAIASTPAGGAHSIIMTIRKGGATLYYDLVVRGTASGSNCAMSDGYIVQLAAADVLTMYVTTSTNETAISTKTTAQSSLSAFWLSP